MGICSHSAVSDAAKPLILYYFFLFFMHVIHTSFECYPVAKAGGLADVVGALPKYLQQSDVTSWVVMPHFDNAWTTEHPSEVVHEGFARLGNERFRYEIRHEQQETLGFPLYLVHIPGRLDRSGIYIDPNSDYAYWDEYERFVSFQVAVLDWLKSFGKKPDIIHCHDHHTALIPFLMTSSPMYHEFAAIPSVLTIHNGNYQGIYEPTKRMLLPGIHSEREGYLYWNGRINALSAGVRTAWRVSTVSSSYLQELQTESRGLELLLRHEKGKSLGILNGIDTDVWNPQTDEMLVENYTSKTLKTGKLANKQWLCKTFSLDPERPLISFIGRLVGEKGADLLPDLIDSFLADGNNASFLILGTGEPWLHKRFDEMSHHHTAHFDASLSYNEELAHRMYAGSDFILMPSRVEPCGLNQMYAMRYGTVPIVRNIGGLRDSVVDISQENGYGIRFDGFNLEESAHALSRATQLYEQSELFSDLQKKIMTLDFSWHNSASHYVQMYRELMNERPL